MRLRRRAVQSSQCKIPDGSFFMTKHTPNTSGIQRSWQLPGRQSWLARASEAGVCRGSDTPNYLCGGDIDISPLENLIPSHANCMQHVLRCWERESDGSEYKKTFRRPGLRHGPRWGNLQRSRKGGEGWLSRPENPVTPLSALRASPLLPPLQNKFRRRWWLA